LADTRQLNEAPSRLERGYLIRVIIRKRARMIIILISILVIVITMKIMDHSLV